MKINLKYKQIILFVSLLLISPVFVLAEKCYVDDGASSGGDGSKGSPYKTIIKALDKGCDSIDIKKGEYEGDIVLGNGVELDGSGKGTIIKGKVTMNDKTELDHLYVKDDGVVLVDGANVLIKNVKITGANIGIKTIGEGKLTVKNTNISHGKKGFYLQYGKDVDIRNCNVSHNKEEAIDIRANVDGIITNNIVESNKESGIEVIAGRSSLIITNNKLKHNNASGIAVQFYKSTKQIGHLKISGNTVIGNRRYGVDCKIPSGGKPMAGYWEKSVQFQYNNVSGNGMGAFSDFCQFSDESILNATKTVEELERMRKEDAERKLKSEEDIIEKEKLDIEARQKAEEKKRQEEIERKREAQKRTDLDIADKIEQILQENSVELKSLVSENEKILPERSQIKVFFIGTDKRILENLEKQASLGEKSLNSISKLSNEIKTTEVKKNTEQQINDKKNELKDIQIKYDKYKNKFALIPWLKDLLHLNKKV
jgi:parallel beta-helix repeat protein